MNEVFKVIRDGNYITLIMRTEGEPDFWHWTVTSDDVRSCFERHNRHDLILQFALGTLSKQGAELFANDPDNDTCGVSGGSFETLDDAVSDIMG